MFSKDLLLAAAMAGIVTAVCPGFNYAIGNKIAQGSNTNRWNVYDDSCKVVDGLTLSSNLNPCDQGIFSCSAAPIHFTGYTNSFNHNKYSCRTDPNAGSCGSDAISVCCRNDGN